MYATSHKKSFVPSVGGIRCLSRGPSQFCETLAKDTNWVTGGSVTFVKSLWAEGGIFDVSPQGSEIWQN